MKKTTYTSIGLIALFLLISIKAFSQAVPFTERFNRDLKGDILLIGNNILGPDNNAFNDPLADNANTDMQYINVDSGGDPSIFSSSSADLVFPDNCYKIVYAGLYWGATTYGLTAIETISPAINEIKFKGPSGGYQDVTGTFIYGSQGFAGVPFSGSYPYACYADVTSIVTSLATDTGTYSVANVHSATGNAFTDYLNATGFAAGWSLFIVYENPALPGKSITSFDGFNYLSPFPVNNIEVTVSGFRTPPAGGVNANFAFSTLEGDKPRDGDRLLLNGTPLATTDRPIDNFFNSTITDLSGSVVANRNPASTNTLGFNAGVMQVPNASNSIIANNNTSAIVRLETARDGFFPYFFALAVDIIEPRIVLTKIVEDAGGNDIGGATVALGDVLTYTIGFENTGNDDADNFTIRDILPNNIIFNYPGDIIDLPPGVTHTYNDITKELIFTIPNNLVEVGDIFQDIKFRVTVETNCSLLNDSCDNQIINQAFASYNGVSNTTFTITDDPSFDNIAACLLNPSPTNFLANLDCTFREEVILCGEEAILTAGNGFDSYLWTRTSANGTQITGTTTQSVTVTEPGIYTVVNTATPPCQSITQIFEVITYGFGVTNPMIPFADKDDVYCTGTNKILPHFYLCGTGDARNIQTNITDASRIIWEKLDETSCTAVTDADCANQSPTCVWNQVGTGPNFTIDTEGQYRLTLDYTGGCVNQYYFNVYTTTLTPIVTSTDIYCTTPGQIVVGGVPSGYVYSIDGVNYQPSNIFTITTGGTYTVYVKLDGVFINPCIFTVPDILILERDLIGSVDIIQPLCHNELGFVILGANNVRPPYTFTITDGAGNPVSGPVTKNDDNHRFNNLNPGIYDVSITTDDGCSFTDTIEIINPPLLGATSALTQPLTCTPGEITVYPTGGTPPYEYFVNGGTVQVAPVVPVPITIPVTASGDYTIKVVDDNNCAVTITQTVVAIPEPDFNINITNVLCHGESTGEIEIDVTNAHGNAIRISIDSGTTFTNSNVFTGLPAGNYDVVLEYTFGGDVCTLTRTVTITEPTEIIATASITTPLDCTVGSNNAEITVDPSITGGTPPYQFSIDGVNFQTTPNFPNLSDGSYTIIVRDDVGCTVPLPVVVIPSLSQPTDLTFSNTPLTCLANLTDVTVTATGGNPPLEYEIIAGPETRPLQPSNIFTGLAPGTYTFQVTDNNGCIYSETYTIAPLADVILDTVLTKGLDCTTAPPEAIITGTVTGATLPFEYTYSVNGTPTGITPTVTGPSPTFTETVTAPGIYEFTITDANNCVAVSTVTVAAISSPIVAVTDRNLNLCFGDSNAAINVAISGGTGPYTIDVTNTDTVPGTPYGSQTSGLPSGNYDITVTDANGCVTTEAHTIPGPPQIDFDLVRVALTCTATGTDLGSITVENVIGGTGDLTYSIINNFGVVPAGSPYTATAIPKEDYTFNIIDFGVYTVTVTDANGCSLSKQITMASPPTDLIVDVSTVSTCGILGGTAIVTASATVVGNLEFAILEFNTPPYALATSYQGPDNPGGDFATFSNLIPGVSYTFVVRETTTGCYYITDVTPPIAPASAITDVVTPIPVVCRGQNNGGVEFTIDNFDGTTTSVDYQIYEAFTNTPLADPTASGNVLVTPPASATVTIPNILSPAQYYIVYTERVGAADGCQTASPVFEIVESAVDLSITAASTNANCNLNSGTISATVVGGTGPYEYQFTDAGDPPVPANWVATSTFNVNAGNYTMHVQDAYGCEVSSADITVNPEPTLIVNPITVTNQCTATEGNFEIAVTATSGVAPLRYSINGSAFQPYTSPLTIAYLSSGTYDIDVEDVNGCSVRASINIQPPLTFTPGVITAATCNDDDGVITITPPTGGIGLVTYSYTITPNPVAPTPASISFDSATNTFTGVPAGLYTITVTDDTTLCSEDRVVSVGTQPAPSITATQTSSVICFGASDGAFDLNVTGYTGAYTYNVLDSLGAPALTGSANTTITNPLPLSGLAAGTYSVEITGTDSPFCSNTTALVITSPASALTLVANETSSVTCTDNLGTITAVASGGWGTYEYELTGAATVAYSSNGTFTGLSAGSYTVNVRDALGCIVSANVTLNLPPAITVTPTATIIPLTCFGDTNGTIEVTPGGGQGSNYSYTLHQTSPTVSSSGPQNSNIFTGLGAGTYYVTVTDGYNCTEDSLLITITQPDLIQSSLILATPGTCIAGPSLILSASGGNGDYEYSDDLSFPLPLGTFTSSTPATIVLPTGAFGTYRYYVRDTNGCPFTPLNSNEITIDPIPPVVVNLDTTNAFINCLGDNTGIIIATAQGGLGGYTYTLLDGAGVPIVGATQPSAGLFTNLPSGDYQVEVQSLGGCVGSSSVYTINDPIDPLIATESYTNSTCYRSDNGRIEIIASGGSGAIKYAISPQLNQFFPTPIFDNLAPGNYQVLAVDELGCFVDFDITITEPLPLLLGVVPNSLIPEVCYGDLDGEFSVNITGGTAPYSVSLDEYNGPYTTGSATQAVFDFTNLAGGDRVVYVRDAQGCESEWPIAFPESVLINPRAIVDYGCTNNLSTNTVTVSVDASVNPAELDYALNGGPFQPSNIFTDVPQGLNHYIDVRHTNGCVQRTNDFDIDDYLPLDLILQDGELNQIVAIASGGAGNNQFTLNGESMGSTNAYYIYESGDYTVTVTDRYGCVSSVTQYFEYIDVCIPNYFTPNNDGNQDGWGPGCTGQYKNLTFDIFDRYGRKIISLRAGEKWNGKYNGIELPTGDYWYVVKLNDSRDNREFVGHFTLYR